MPGNNFFAKINYSACNEDSESERLALQIKPGDTVLCITGSGARALDMLADNPQKIISVDFNTTQNFLLELKMAAFSYLTYIEFSMLMGLAPCSERMYLYLKIKYILTSGARIFWDSNIGLIKNGVLFCGAWETWLRNISDYAFFRKGKTNRLINCVSLNEQKEYWHTSWNNKTWRYFLGIICNRFIWEKVIREPGASLIPKDFNIAGYMQKRFDHMADNWLIRQNHFAYLLLTGTYDGLELLPWHLRAENFEMIKNNVYKIKIITGALSDVIQDKEITRQVTAYSLSDISSYASRPVYDSIWKDLDRYATSHSRFCERHFLVKYAPVNINQRIRRNHFLEKHLQDKDLSFIYSFCAGTIA